MGRLTVERSKAVWIDRARSYSVEVDGTVRGKVASGKSLSIDLGPGSHSVRMKVDWCYSRPVTVDGSRDTRLRCEPGANPFTAIFYVIFWRHDYIRLERA